MFNLFLNKLSTVQKGMLSIALGAALVLGALGKLGFLQDFLNLIMIIVGLFLLFYGAQATHLWNNLKGTLKGKK